MKVALITIGNELLSGFTVNTNAAWIGIELGRVGIEISVQHTIQDEKKDIIFELEQVSKKVSIVIVTGGLGPTHDDVTASAFYSYFNDTPVFDEDYWRDLTDQFSKINYKIPDVNQNQAMKPKKGDCIPNDFGSARGLLYKINNCLYFALPGVPKEMKAMMKKSVIPILKDQVTNPFITRTIRTTGIPESALAEKITNTIDMRTYNCSLAYLPKLLGVDLRISSQDEQQIQKFEKKINPVIEKYVYGYEDEALEEVVGNTLKKCSVTLATAESCTGGLLGHRITQVSGSSEYYLGGVVSYNEDAKINLSI